MSKDSLRQKFHCWMFMMEIIVISQRNNFLKALSTIKLIQITVAMQIKGSPPPRTIQTKIACALLEDDL